MSTSWSSKSRFGGKKNYSSQGSTVNVFQQSAPKKQYQSTSSQKKSSKYAAPGPEMTEEQHKEYVERCKVIRDGIWAREMTLACLVGRKPIPICFAQGHSLITDYAVWKDYHGKALYAFAETIVNQEMSSANTGGVFTWGVRPVDPRYLTHYKSPEAADWIWAFMVQNIGKYSAALNNLLVGIRKVSGDNAEVVKAFRDALKNGANPNDEMLGYVQNLVVFYAGYTPSMLKQGYEQEITDPSYSFALGNLKQLQMVDQNQQKIRVLQRQINSSADISAEISRTASPDPTPRRPLTQKKQEKIAKQEQEFISETTDADFLEETPNAPSTGGFEFVPPKQKEYPDE